MTLKELIKRLNAIRGPETEDLQVELMIDFTKSDKAQYQATLQEIAVSTRYQNGVNKGSPTKIILIYDEHNEDAYRAK